MQEKYCVVCNKPNAKVCSGCGDVNYCSKECQITNWKEHKDNCPGMGPELAQTEELGRHFIASKNIKAGSLVLSEKAAFFGPDNSHPFLPSCLSCCVATCNKCSKCGWPVCSDSCEKAKHHAEYECKLISKTGKPKYSRREDIVGIEVLRVCLTKYQDPEVWAKVLTLQSDLCVTTSGHVRRDNELECKAVEARRKFQFVNENISHEDWLRVYRIIKINAFSLQTTMAKNDNHTHGTFLFLKCSMFTNSCSPNCSFTVSPAPHFKMSVRAAVDIQKGEVLTLLYNNSLLYLGTHKRQKIIGASWGFICKCRRCLDKTELGTNLSTWICSKCQSFILPEDPLNDSSDWTCSNCENTLTNDRVDQLTSQIYTQVQSCMAAAKNARLFYKILKKYSGKHLHENHWILIEARRGIVLYLSNIIYDGSGTEEQKNEYFENAHRILDVMKFVAPGISHATASLKISLGLLAKNKAEDDFMDGRIGEQEFADQIRKAYTWSKEALEYFLHDTSETPDLKLIGPQAQQLMYTLEQLKTYEDKFGLV